MCSCGWFGGHQILILKDQAAIVSEPLRSIKQMASYWDLKWLKQVEPNDPVDLNNSTADVCFAHIFFSPEKVLLLEEYPYISELQDNLARGHPGFKWSASCVIRHVFFCGYAQGLLHKVVLSAMICLMLWTYEGKHFPPKCLKQGIWSNRITWSQRIYAVCEFTSWFYSQNLWICFQHAPCNLQDV